MASVVSLVGSLGLLLVSALPEVLGDRPSPDRRAHSEPRCPCLFPQQGKDGATFLQEEAGKKDSLQSEQQLAQLTQQLAQTEQHLNSLMAQLEPLFER
ncbi:hypothetical protein E2I00_013999 [Balaenoptera physalus]|uniref:Uncharacterized protein n=1 Tax=Balaenoptera physalus TaxID=9770 RepID=A0A643BZG2_BALPH|nr:hypothetical protein E2I00_013999 [Balaenoptera physalus]